MKFMALGGAQEIGASCYYLELGGKRFLLDCGRGSVNGRVYAPRHGELTEQNCLLTPAQLDAIFISHGHFDHIGALPLFTDLCPRTPVYATSLTKELGDWLLWDNYSCRTCKRQAWDDLKTEKAISRIQTVAYGKPFAIGGVRITLYPAGHVPGAAMIYFESAEGSVLYTGDFNPKSTALTLGYSLPEQLHPDTVIMCGTHCKHPYYTAVGIREAGLKEIACRAKRGEDVFVSVRQLTKGVEVLSLLQQELPGTPVYIDESIASLASQVERLGIAVRGENCGLWIPGNREPGVYLGNELRFPGVTPDVRFDFTLHASFADCEALLRKLNPGTAFLVHAPADKNGFHDGYMRERLPNINVLYPERGHLYAN